MKNSDKASFSLGLCITNEQVQVEIHSLTEIKSEIALQSQLTAHKVLVFQDLGPLHTFLSKNTSAGGRQSCTGSLSLLEALVVSWQLCDCVQNRREERTELHTASK